MPAQTLNFTVDDATIRIADSGRIDGVEHAQRPGQNYVRPHQAVPAMIIDDHPLAWEPAGVAVDEDEIETRYTTAQCPGLEFTVRNAFTGSWTQRQMLVNTSPAPIALDNLTASVPVPEDMFAQGGVFAHDAYWIVHPADGQGPLLTVRLSHGAIYGQTAAGLCTGAVRLEPGRRFVLQWVLDFEPCGPSLARRLTDGATARTQMWADEFHPVGDADTAVLAPDPIEIDHEDGTQMLGSPRAGRFAVELRSARGSRQVELAWVPRPDELLARRSPHWLAGERSGSGAPVLGDSGAALGLQHALGVHLIDMPETADDALVQHAARLLDQEHLTGLDLAMLAQETLRTADPEPLDRARTEMLARTRPVAGLGLAATRVGLAELAAGSMPEALLEHLHGLCRRHRTSPDTGGDCDPTPAPVAALELNAVAGELDASGPHGLAGSTALPGALLRIAAALGHGLPVRTVHDPHRHAAAPVVHSYFAAVLDLMPESLGPEFAKRCGRTPHELAEQARASALADALWPSADQPRDDRQLDEVIGWIVVGQPAAGDM